MTSTIPTISAVRSALEGLTHAQLQRLSSSSGVPFTTLWKIKDGTTKNPGIETVRQFLPILLNSDSEEGVHAHGRGAVAHEGMPPQAPTAAQAVGADG